MNINIPRPSAVTVNESGLFDINDEAILAEIAGGLSSTVEFLDNGCTHNKSECGKTAISPSRA